MKWIKSLGGPLILLPRDSVHLWSGSFGPAGEDDWDEEDTDYERIAGGVTDFAEAVDVRGKSALVLANGNSPTCFLESHSLFVQLLATSSEVDVVAAVTRILPSIHWQHSTEWLCEGPSLLFDSAMYGPDVGDEHGLEVNVGAGKYMVRCAYREPDSSAGIWVALTMLVPIT